MNTRLLTLGLAILVCTLAASATSALAASEFHTVGNQVKIASGEGDFGIEGALVVCGSSSGTGKVTSAKETAIQVRYEKCEADFGEKEAAAKVTECHFVFNTSSKVTLTEGCTMEASGCVVKQASSTPLEEANLVGLKEAEKGGLESEVVMGAHTITETVNKACEELGVKGSKTGFLEGVLIADNVTDGPPNTITVEGAAVGKEKEYRLVSSTQYKIKFLNAQLQQLGYYILCEKFGTEGKTSVESASVRLLNSPHGKTAPPTSTGCKIRPSR